MELLILTILKNLDSGGGGVRHLPPVPGGAGEQVLYIICHLVRAAFVSKIFSVQECEIFSVSKSEII